VKINDFIQKLQKEDDRLVLCSYKSFFDSSELMGSDSEGKTTRKDNNDRTEKEGPCEGIPSQAVFWFPCESPDA
jgi:hypothetical protein